MDETAEAPYRLPEGRAEATIRTQRSRFLACLQAASDPAQAAATLEALKRRHHDATHYCWAWRLGAPPSERSSDAGEPPGTAGRPILQVLRGAGLSDVVAVVVRWFGGTRLGRGGLSRAYTSATQEALARLRTVERTLTANLEIEVPYSQLARLKRLIQPPEICVQGEHYGETAHLSLRVHQTHREELEDQLQELGLSWASPAK